MNLNLTKKIITKHLVAGNLDAGQEIGLRVDQALIHDATGQMVLLQFEAMGLSRIKVDRAVIYADHNTIQVGPENMDDHLFLASAGRKFGFHYSRPGNGICHQLHLERFSVPGETLLGADSHTTTGGGAGMLAIGVGGLDVAAALAGHPFFMVMPKVVRFTLVGELQPWVSAKDIALEMLRLLGVSGGRGKVLEFTGPGVETLNVPQRATIANMSIETGAFTAVFPSDQMTRRFLAAQDRESEWSPLSADSGAEYDEEYVIDLARLEPLIAKPHSPDNVVPVRAVAGTPVDQVGIGSCTNSSLEDLGKVGVVLRGRTVAPNISLIITPGSRQALKGIYASGALGDLIDAGARILENVCGFCNGLDQSPRAAGLSLRTSNRNFPGRSGTADAGIYLTSPETAAATAITGKITDPRTLGEAPRVMLPEKFPIDDRMILPPSLEGAEIEIHRGPNISKLPRFEALPDSLEGVVLLKRDDNVTTDDILPGGANILKLRSNIPAIAKFIFSRIDPTFCSRAQAAGIGFIVGGLNYGQGSSREHAALAPRYLGVRAVIARSFARIHKSNLINYGILPLEFIDPTDLNRIQAGDRLRMAGLTHSAGNERTITVENLTSGKSIAVRIDVSVRLHKILLAGGLLNRVKGEGTDAERDSDALSP